MGGGAVGLLGGWWQAVHSQGICRDSFCPRLEGRFQECGQSCSAIHWPLLVSTYIMLTAVACPSSAFPPSWRQQDLESRPTPRG